MIYVLTPISSRRTIYSIINRTPSRLIEGKNNSCLINYEPFLNFAQVVVGKNKKIPRKRRLSKWILYQHFFLFAMLNFWKTCLFSWILFCIQTKCTLFEGLTKNIYVSVGLPLNFKIKHVFFIKKEIILVDDASTMEHLGKNWTLAKLLKNNLKFVL